jgi:hypothetical protein
LDRQVAATEQARVEELEVQQAIARHRREERQRRRTASLLATVCAAARV